MFATMRTALLGLVLILTLAAPSLAVAPVPRKSPDLVIVGASGAPVSLSLFKGKVVVVEFLLIRCARCARAAQTISKLQNELGPRGFQAIGVAFDKGMSAPMVAKFAEALKFGFPVGYTTSDKVDNYLGRAAMERLQVPQMVVIDQAGVIRAQSLVDGDQDLENETYLGGLIDRLLRKGAAAGG